MNINLTVSIIWQNIVFIVHAVLVLGNDTLQHIR